MRAFQFGSGVILAALPLWAGAVQAQDNQQAPQIFTLPGAQNYSLPSSRPTPQVSPTPSPTPAPTPAATVPIRPVVIPPVQPTRPTATATPVPRATPTPAPAARTTPVPTPLPTQAAAPVSAVPTPQATAAPNLPASPIPEATAAAPAPQATGVPAWLWWAGAGLVALLAAGAGLWLRGRRRAGEAAEALVAAPASAPQQPSWIPPAVVPPPAPRPTPRPAAAPRPVPQSAPLRPAPPPAPPRPAPQPAAAPSPATSPAPQFLLRPATPRGMRVELHPIRADVGEAQTALDFELVVTNDSGEKADDIRVVLGMVSASPAQDRMIGGFHASAKLAQPAPPFALAPGASHRFGARLALSAEAIHVVTSGGRPMFVPIVMANLRWRAGLSVKSLAETHMVGVAPAEGNRLGPFWLDRGPHSQARLATKRYDPVPA